MSSSPSGRPTALFLRRGVQTLLVGVAAYYAVWGGEYSVFDIRTLSVRQQTAGAELTELYQEVESLRLLEEKLRDDSATIESVARERFGMIREGELLYRFIEVDTASAP